MSSTITTSRFASIVETVKIDNKKVKVQVDLLQPQMGHTTQKVSNREEELASFLNHEERYNSPSMVQELILGHEIDLATLSLDSFYREGGFNHELFEELCNRLQVSTMDELLYLIQEAEEPKEEATLEELVLQQKAEAKEDNCILLDSPSYKKDTSPGGCITPFLNLQERIEKGFETLTRMGEDTKVFVPGEEWISYNECYSLYKESQSFLTDWCNRFNKFKATPAFTEATPASKKRLMNIFWNGNGKDPGFNFWKEDMQKYRFALSTTKIWQGQWWGKLLQLVEDRKAMANNSLWREWFVMQDEAETEVEYLQFFDCEELDAPKEEVHLTFLRAFGQRGYRWVIDDTNRTIDTIAWNHVQEMKELESDKASCSSGNFHKGWKHQPDNREELVPLQVQFSVLPQRLRRKLK